MALALADLDTWSPERLHAIFRHYADVDFPAADALLYAAIADRLCGDPETMSLAATVRAGQPPPNLLFAAVHELLLDGEQHPLASYYPDLTTTPRPRDEAYPAFRDFCALHRGRIARIAQTRLVQTNVLERCGLLLPAFAAAATALASPSGPVAIIEVGASAGLNLLWDRYAYDYGTRSWGNSASPVQLRIEVRGAAHLPLIRARLRSGWARGIDLDPVDLSDAASLLWQRALIWPERGDRQQRLDAARRLMDEQRSEPLIKADATDALGGLLREAPLAFPVIVAASFSLYQFPQESRARLLDVIAAAAEYRPIALVTAGINRGDAFATVAMMTFDGERRREVTLARGHPHGSWIEWVAPQ